MSYQDLNLNDLPGWRNPENLARRVDAATDAFGRLRIASPRTLFDSKQIFDNQPLFWADIAASGGGTGSAHSAARASSILSVSENTAGSRVRQPISGRRSRWKRWRPSLRRALPTSGS